MEFARNKKSGKYHIFIGETADHYSLVTPEAKINLYSDPALFDEIEEYDQIEMLEGRQITEAQLDTYNLYQENRGAENIEIATWKLRGFPKHDILQLHNELLNDSNLDVLRRDKQVGIEHKGIEGSIYYDVGIPIKFAVDFPMPDIRRRIIEFLNTPQNFGITKSNRIDENALPTTNEAYFEFALSTLRAKTGVKTYFYL